MISKSKLFSKVRTRLSNSSSKTEHQSILKGLVTVALFVFFGKILGACKEMAIAYRYGVSSEVDGYLFVLSLVGLPIGIWTSILMYVLVPLAGRLRGDAPSELPRFRGELFAFTLVLGIDLALLACLGLPTLLGSSWVGLSGETVRIATQIIPSMSVLMPLGMLASVFSALMLSAGRHANTLLESVPALAVLLAVLILPLSGVEPLMWGTLSGSLAHTCILVVILAWRNEFAAPRFTHNSPYWSDFWKGFGIMLIGSGLGSINTIIDQFYAAQLDVGSISTLSYANRILALILGLGATAIGRATLPVFSKLKSEGIEKLQSIAIFWVRLMFMAGFIVVIMVWWLAPWIVKLLFERGAFTAENTQVVTGVFRYGLAQVPFYFASMALVTLLAAQGRHKIIAMSGAANLLVKASANYILVPILGINAIMLSAGVMYMISLFLLYWFGTRFVEKNEATK